MLVVHGFLNRSPMPGEGAIGIAADVIARPGRDALGKCIDLSREVSNPTLVLAEMFGNDHQGLPPHWKQEPEKARTVLSMSGYIELGILQAARLYLAGQRETSLDSETEIQSLTKFVEDLQAK